RIRRTAEEARQAILAAAVEQLRASGPASIRLAEIARDVGVSHPAILHHFGSREELLKAVVQEALERLHGELFEVLSHAEASEASSVEILDAMAETLETAGHARIIAWLSLSGVADAMDQGRMRQVAEVVHARRLEALPHGIKAPHFEDTLFTCVLATHAIMGEALLGRALRQSSGLGDDPAASTRFRRWLARLLVEKLEPGE
ncbi:MAG: TetR/AcrR family transcriptional regulator, partial [Myxococcales bacterium]|nr:TetR/AcrR family transcriptional regulator [Myxococcales bacterium]